MYNIPDIVCHGEMRNRSSWNISHPGKNVSRVIGKVLEVFFAGDPAEHKHGIDIRVDTGDDVRVQRGGLKSDYFDIKTNKLLIRAFVWGVKGQTISQFGLSIQGYSKLRRLERSLHPKPRGLRLITDENTQISDRVMGENILERIKP